MRYEELKRLEFKEFKESEGLSIEELNRDLDSRGVYLGKHDLYEYASLDIMRLKFLHSILNKDIFDITQSVGVEPEFVGDRHVYREYMPIGYLDDTTLIVVKLKIRGMGDFYRIDLGKGESRFDKQLLKLQMLNKNGIDKIKFGDRAYNRGKFIEGSKRCLIDNISGNTDIRGLAVYKGVLRFGSRVNFNDIDICNIVNISSGTVSVNNAIYFRVNSGEDSEFDIDNCELVYFPLLNGGCMKLGENIKKVQMIDSFDSRKYYGSYRNCRVHVKCNLSRVKLDTRYKLCILLKSMKCVESTDDILSLYDYIKYAGTGTIVTMENPEMGRKFVTRLKELNVEDIDVIKNKTCGLPYDV